MATSVPLRPGDPPHPLATPQFRMLGMLCPQDPSRYGPYLDCEARAYTATQGRNVKLRVIQ